MSLGHHHRPVVAIAPSPRAQMYRGQRGFTMVMFGLMLVPLLLMVGLSVDVGYWYNRASDMQKAADAGALAGVVWLPDGATAATVAQGVTKRNGFDDAALNISVTAVKSSVSNRRLVVTICDDKVGSFFYRQLTGKTVRLCRKGLAEYVLPVPLGSPRNFFGTGQLLAGGGYGFPSEELFASINPYCTDKVNGDRYQSGYVGGTCSGTVNDDYRTRGYELYIEAPEARTSDIQVRLWDARYNDACANLVTGWGSSAGVVGDFDSYGSNRTFSGPDRQYWNGTDWVELTSNRQSASSRYWKVKINRCDDPDPAIDSKRQSGDEDYTFTLFAADNTPLNDNDNPQMCTRTFSKNTPYEYSYLGSFRWNTLCTIPQGAMSGRYILRMTNGGAVTNPEADGSNQYGVVAKYTSSGAVGLCDGRVTANCPRVFGKDAISVRAAATASTAQFYLAEIAPEHKGKKLKIKLFDPGEGGRYLRILKPTGANTWTPVTFDWKAPGVSGSPGTTANLSVRSGTTDLFNGKLLDITVDLAGYTPPANNNWWKIEYEFAGADVTDRTTWEAEVIGDPVHLVEEY